MISLSPALQNLYEKIKGRRFRRIAFYILIGVAVGAIVTPIVIIPVLNAIGFSAAGPVAGTLAAGIQSSIGNVAAGSLFAAAQSTAMGAGIAAAFPAIGGAVTGGLTVAGIAVHQFVRSTALDARVVATLVTSREAATRSVTMAGAAAYEFLNFSQAKERLPSAAWFRRAHQPVGM